MTDCIDIVKTTGTPKVRLIGTAPFDIYSFWENTPIIAGTRLGIYLNDGQLRDISRSAANNIVEELLRS